MITIFKNFGDSFQNIKIRAHKGMAHKNERASSLFKKILIKNSPNTDCNKRALIKNTGIQPKFFKNKAALIILERAQAKEIYFTNNILTPY